MAIATRKKPSSGRPKKLSGKHHKRGQSYLKTYWPYIPLIAIVALGIALNGLWSNGSHGVQGYAVNISPSGLLSDTNAERLAKNENVLTINSELSAAAQAKANDMVKRDYWSHVTPDGVQPWQFIENQGYRYQDAGENLAYGFGSSSAVLKAWMASPEHRANILKANYKNIGFGIVNSPDFNGNGPQTLVVAMYGNPMPVSLASAKPVKAAVPTVLLGTTGDSEPVSRVQLISGGANYAMLATILEASLAATLFILRHGLALKKVFVEGEEFVLHHRYFDIVIVSLAVAGAILVQTAGTIL
jgi:hypothetical protein